MTTSRSNGVQPFGFRDAEDYIERITYDIWNRPAQPRLCLRYYTTETRIHTDAGDVVGAQAVLDNTLARLGALPDFHGQIDDAIVTGDEESGYRTSMRWRWTGTWTGPWDLGAPTGAVAAGSAIANCHTVGEHIVREWLASNRLQLTRSLGVEDRAALGNTTSGGPCEAVSVLGRDADISDAARAVADATVAAIAADPVPVERLWHPDSPVTVGRDAMGAGAEAYRRVLDDLAAAIGAARHVLSDVFSVTRDGVERVALQSHIVNATDPSRSALVLAHHHVRDGLVVSSWISVDDLELLRNTGIALGDAGWSGAESPCS